MYIEIHMYKYVLGPDRFPDGVFEWPPTQWLAEYHARKRRRGTSIIAPSGDDEPAKKALRQARMKPRTTSRHPHLKRGITISMLGR